MGILSIFGLNCLGRDDKRSPRVKKLGLAIDFALISVTDRVVTTHASRSALPAGPPFLSDGVLNFEIAKLKRAIYSAFASLVNAIKQSSVVV